MENELNLKLFKHSFYNISTYKDRDIAFKHSFINDWFLVSRYFKEQRNVMPN